MLERTFLIIDTIITHFSVIPFDAESLFTIKAIDHLKVSAEISLIEELVHHTLTAFPVVSSVKVRGIYNHILREWASGRGPHPPTWTELFRVIKKMGLSELAGRMEKYLRGSVPEDPPRPPPDEEGDSEEEKDGKIISDYLFLTFKIPQMKHQSKKFSG